jgi:alkylhydroperoxidase family enzyme
MTARIEPAAPPFSDAIQRRLDQVMPPGAEPLVLFTTLARDARLFERFMGGGLLDRGHLTLRQREIVIDRVTANCRAEYEWGVHVAVFATRVGLTVDQLESIQHGAASDQCWNHEEAVLIALCDALHDSCDVDDELWARLTSIFDAETIMELLLLCGFYRTVSYLVKGLRLPLEPGAAHFTGDR